MGTDGFHTKYGAPRVGIYTRPGMGAYVAVEIRLTGAILGKFAVGFGIAVRAELDLGRQGFRMTA